MKVSSCDLWAAIDSLFIWEILVLMLNSKKISSRLEANGLLNLNYYE